MHDIYNIIELANVHGGEPDLVLQIINEFNDLKEVNGIKFQPFKYDEISLKDYKWYKVYKKLYFTPESWGLIIKTAAKSKHVWIDTFDHYTLKIINSNRHHIFGLKFQASNLYNEKLITDIAKIDLKDKCVILNISGYEISRIKKIIYKFQAALNPREIILQIGFQSYPTLISDSGLSKIESIKKNFSNPVSFADHIDAESENSILLPVIATMLGASYIEKHIKLKGDKPEYDYYSSIDIDLYRKYLAKLKEYQSTLKEPFINKNEKIYLKSTIQIPVLSVDIPKGSLININKEVDFKRTNQIGLTIDEIKGLVYDHNILSLDKKKNQTLIKNDFKKARIAAIIAGRMKSSRLKQKAIIPIHGISSIERCLYSCSLFSEIDELILATSSLEEDAILENYTLGGKAKLWKGDPDDVISRYLGACEVFDIDIVMRVTADCPVVSSEIAEILLKSHFASGADYTGARDAAVGTFCEIYNTEALRRVIKYLGKADYSEYMTWYMRNNADIFKVNIVDLPSKYVRDYRLTLDYDEDLKMFEILYSMLEKKGLKQNITNIFNILDNNPSIPALNSHITLKYKTDQELINKLNIVTRIPGPDN